MKKLLALLLGLGALALLGSRLSGSSGDPPPAEANLYTVKRGTVPITLTETGTLNTKKAANVHADVEGSAKIAWLIDEGASVASGDVVAQLDKTEVKKRLDELENARIQGESELKAAKTDCEVQEAQNKTDCEKAQLALEVAEFNKRKLLEGDIPAEKKKRQLRINKAQSDLQKQKEKYETLPGLLEQGFVTKAQVEEARLKVEEATVELEAANGDMELYTKFQEPLDTKQKTADVVQAEREVGRVKQRTDSLLEQKQAVILQRELTLKATLRQLEEHAKKLEAMTLRAPIPGIVVYGDPANPWEKDRIKVGGEVWHSMIVVTIPDTEEMSVTVQVHEADVNAVSSGMPTTITLDTYKGIVLKGAVSRVASVANAGGWLDNGVKKFTVDIAVIGSNLNLRPGITANVEIAVGEMKDALYVPLQAVRVKDGKHRCLVRSRGRTVATDVEIGRSNDHYVEIKKGIEEGQVVLLYDPQAGESPVEPPPPAAPVGPPGKP